MTKQTTIVVTGALRIKYAAPYEIVSSDTIGQQRLRSVHALKQPEQNLCWSLIRSLDIEECCVTQQSQTAHVRRLIRAFAVHIRLNTPFRLK